MTVDHLEVLVEEQSMEAALHQLLPKIVGEIEYSLHPHQGKRQFLASLPGKLKGYARWLPPTSRIVVVVDCDQDDCHHLKQELEKAALDAGLPTKSAPNDGQYVVLNRIAIEELEAWFFGDWEAVRAAYPRVSPNVTSRARYRNSDEIKGGTWEALERLLRRSGHLKTGLRKIELARRVARHMEPERNQSPSMQAFRDALKELVSIEVTGTL